MPCSSKLHEHYLYFRPGYDGDSNWWKVKCHCMAWHTARRRALILSLLHSLRLTLMEQENENAQIEPCIYMQDAVTRLTNIDSLL